jgi:drug/metabolite transporter (DMT)-like permease
MLTVSTLFWGLSFPLGKDWQVRTAGCPGGPGLSSLTVIALRTVLALALFAVFQRRLFVLPTRRELAIGLFLGFLSFLGCYFQILGLASTTPALSGFFTSLASAWVPLLALVLFRIPLAKATLVGIALGIAGASLLELNSEDPWILGGGEALTLLSSVMFAFVILLLDRLGRRVESTHLTVGFVAMTGIPAIFLAPVWAATGPGIPAWTNWLRSVFQSPPLLFDLGMLTVLCTVLAYHWMTTYQPRIPASRAALIYLLEPLWAAGFSIAWGFDSLTGRLILGGGLIIGGNLLVELPLWYRTLLKRHRDVIAQGN